jgi:alpha-tubulin suppressor-like RCC1 family protein
VSLAAWLRRALRCLPLLLLLGCGRLGFNLNAIQDGGIHKPDTGTRRGPLDAGGLDAAAADSGGLDAGMLDGGAPDAATPQGTTLLRGFGHMCVISDGKLSCWGSNASGELGLGDTLDRNVPEALHGSWISGCGGETYTCAIHEGGALYCWGDNSHGQLGLGDLNARSEPTKLPGSAYWTAVSCIGAYTCGLQTGGLLYCWGDNSEGATGQNDAQGAPDLTTPQPVAANETFREVSTGQGHACAIRQDGALFCWGRNTSGQLGLGDAAADQVRSPQRVGKDMNWQTLGVGQEHTCAIRMDGFLWCWGSNVELALGYPTPGGATLVKVPMRVAGMTKWRQVSASRLDSCAVSTDGAGYCWGRGDEGQLGNGTTDSKGVPTRIGKDNDWMELAVSWFYNCGRRRDDSVWCWGQNDGGQLGLGDMVRRSSPARVSLP